MKTDEQKLEVSKEILNKLMNPNITLEESLTNIKQAQKMIEEAKIKIQIIEKNKIDSTDGENQ